MSQEERWKKILNAIYEGARKRRIAERGKKFLYSALKLEPDDMPNTELKQEVRRYNESLRKMMSNNTIKVRICKQGQFPVLPFKMSVNN